MELFDFIKNGIVFEFIEYLLSAGPVIGINREHSRDDFFEVFRVNAVIFESGLKLAFAQIDPFFSEAKTG